MAAGLMVIWVEIEDYNQAQPNQQDLQQWANQYGLKCPVLADQNYQLVAHFMASSAIPTFVLIKYDGTILLYDDWNQINNVINDSLPPYGGPDGWPQDWL